MPQLSPWEKGEEEEYYGGKTSTEEDVVFGKSDMANKRRRRGNSQTYTKFKEVILRKKMSWKIPSKFAIW